MTAPTQQEAIAMAREAGLYLDSANTQKPLWVLTHDELHKLVAAAYAQSIADAAMVAFCMNGASGADISKAIRNRSKP